MKFKNSIFATCLFAISLTGAVASELEFTSQPYEHKQVGHLVAGQTLTVKYDTNRLDKCTAAGRLYQSYTVAYYRFDNGEIQTTGSFTELLDSKDSIVIPQNAQSLEIWFRNYTLANPTGPAVCDAYDSDFGNNYHFEIQ